MANKDKLLNTAQKFLAKGQVAKAIGEYQKLVRAFPKEIRNRQKLAELLSRDKRNEEALAEYETVANHYADTGFYLKAIAVYKQMQKLEPSRVNIFHRLAELNEKQGLIGNALTEYRNLVTFYEQNEMTSEAIKVLQKMAELDPDNLNIRAKITECYIHAGRSEEALESFLDIVTYLGKNNEHVKVIRLYDRFQEVCDDEPVARLPLAAALLENDQADKALSILKSLFKAAPEETEIMQYLVDAYLANGDLSNARLTLHHLMNVIPDDLSLRERYARVCLQEGEAERARESLEDYKEFFVQAGKTSELKALYQDLQNALPDDETVQASLLAICETPVDTGQHEEETSEERTVGSENNSQENAVLDHAVGGALESEKAGETIEPDQTTGSTISDTPEAIDETEEVEVELEIEIDFDGLSDLESGFDPWEKLAPKVGEPDSESSVAPPVIDNQQETGFAQEAFPAESREESQAADDPEELFELEEIEELESVVDKSDESVPASLPASDEAAAVRNELEESEFYLEQGMFDDAEKVISNLLVNHPDDKALLTKLEEVRTRRETEKSLEQTVGFTDMISELEDEELLGAADFLGEEFVESSSNGFVRELATEIDSEDTESHFNLGIAYKEMGLYDEALEEFDKASKDPDRLIDCLTFKGQCYLDQGCYAEAEQVFKQGLGHDSLSDELQMTLHYEMGVLYQASGRSLEALDSFQQVADKDLFFRDVGKKVKALRSELGLDKDVDDDGPKGNQDRVSYV